MLLPVPIEDVVRSIQGLGNDNEVIVDKERRYDTITLKVNYVKN